MNPPYSVVCARGHVLADDVPRQPEIASNGKLGCSEPGCFERVYTHCEGCSKPVPGYIDGVRYEGNGSIATPRGRLGPPERVWREECPYCKMPYRWASESLLSRYHAKYLEDVEDPSPMGLVFSSSAEAAYGRAKAGARRRRKSERRADRRERKAHWYTSRAALISAVAAVAVAIIGLVPWLFDDNDIVPSPSPSSSTVSPTTTSLGP